MHPTAPNRMPTNRTTGSRIKPEEETLRERKQRPTRVYIVDAHPAVRKALTLAINRTEDLRVVGQGGTVEEALLDVDDRTSDVVVVDLSVDEIQGCAVIKRIRASHPDVRIVVFSMFDETIYAERAVWAGATGYVMKTEATSEVVAAIRTVRRDQVYLSRKTVSGLLRQVIRRQDDSVRSPTEWLTDREKTVFAKLGTGLSVRAIAEELGLSRKTVETYRRRAKEKLGCSSVQELVEYAANWTKAPPR